MFQSAPQYAIVGFTLPLYSIRNVTTLTVIDCGSPRLWAEIVKNIQASKQHLCKLIPSLGKMCAKVYAVLLRKLATYVAILRFLG